MHRLCLRAAAPWPAILLAGCAASFVTQYDQVLDSRITELHAKIETFLDSMELAPGAAESAYRTNWHFYVECVSEAQTLRRRASADAYSDLAVGLSEIAVAVDGLRRAHEGAGTLDRAVIQQIRPVLRAWFDLMYKREAAIRRGP
jgi:hypothetical protein